MSASTKSEEGLSDELSDDVNQSAVRASQFAEDTEVIGTFDRKELARCVRGDARFVKAD
jgi:hypothetical protein